MILCRSIGANGVYMHRMRYEYGVYMMLPTVQIIKLKI